MYTSFFGLNEKPFSITPDPRYLYMSERHSEALAHLVYGITESGGFIQLTGEVGTGKTTLIRSLLQQLPENTEVALILNPQLSCIEFLIAIIEDLRIGRPSRTANVKSLITVLNHYLLKNHSKGRRTVLIVDEAQNLTVDVLEQIRLLTNLETARQKLLQITLIGQPELRKLLNRDDMRQLAQRITGRYHLEPLSREETSAYIEHRLNVAGATGSIFTASAREEVFRHSDGVPRIINVVSDRALLGAYTQDQPEVSPALVRLAAEEVYDTGKHKGKWWRIAAAAIAIVAVALGLVWTGIRIASGPTLEAVPTAGDAIAEIDVSKPGTIISPNPAEPANGGSESENIRQPLDEVLQRHGGAATSTDAAFDTLFRLWGVEHLQNPSNACDQAEMHNLYCLYQRGSLSQVQSLNRPVILSLRDNSGSPHHVVLQSMGDDRGTIAIGNNTFPVSLGDVADHWFGEYLLLWRPQIGEQTSFYPGMRDPRVTWLRESLAVIQGRPIAPMNSDHYDQDLEARVKDYQKSRRLDVDGLVGQQTQIAINSDLGTSGIPKLVTVN
jgi:general secretion pathway protein A